MNKIWQKYNFFGRNMIKSMQSCCKHGFLAEKMHQCSFLAKKCKFPTFTVGNACIFLKLVDDVIEHNFKDCFVLICFVRSLHCRNYLDHSRFFTLWRKPTLGLKLDRSNLTSQWSNGVIATNWTAPSTSNVLNRFMKS